MRRFWLMGVCAAMAVVVSALAAASASASLPALYECAKATKVGKPAKYTGHYTDKKCSKEATKKEIEEGKANKYELQEWNKEAKKGKVKKFKGKGKGANLEVKGQNGVACTSSSDVGEFTGPKTGGNVVVTFKGCETAGEKCTNTATAGEVTTNKLSGEVGYLAGGGTGKPIVGISIGAEAPGKFAAEFHCGDLNVRVHGHAIGEVSSTDVNVFTKKATLIYEQHAGEQKWPKFESGVKEVLFTEECKGELCKGSGEGESGDLSAEETKVENTGEELELKA